MGEVAVTPAIRFEIFSGAKDGMEYEKYERNFKSVVLFKIHEEIWRESQRQAYQLRRQGIRVPLVDLLSAIVAQVNGTAIFHNDRHFDLMARHLSFATISWDEKTGQFLRRQPGVPPQFKVAEVETQYVRSPSRRRSKVLAQK